MKYAFTCDSALFSIEVESEHSTASELAEMFVAFMRAAGFSDKSIEEGMLCTDLLALSDDQPEDH